MFAPDLGLESAVGRDYVRLAHEPAVL